MKHALSRLDLESRALLVSIIWLLIVQVLVALAWDAGLLTRRAALLHWLCIGVLPAALALWQLPEGSPPAT